MIDAVEAMYEEDGLRESDSYRWEKLNDQLEHLIGSVQHERSCHERESNDNNTPEYDNLESMLCDVQKYVEGRIEELRPGYYEGKYESVHYASRRQQEMMRYALQECINYVGLHEVFFNPLQCKDAIEYIVEHKLASMNYEATCKAVDEYLAVTFQQRMSELLSQKGA